MQERNTQYYYANPDKLWYAIAWRGMDAYGMLHMWHGMVWCGMCVYNTF